MIIFIFTAILVAAVLATSYVCFRMAFYVTKDQKICKEEYPVPEGEIYAPWRDVMIKWMKETRAISYRSCSITSFDGLTLQGKFYEYAPGAPIELMMHGYRGNANRDLCGGVQRSFALGHSALVIDQRGCGDSDGNVITFGIRESKDCLDWVDYLIQTFGPDVKIILTGISMGASTVLMAAGQPLPKNVIGVLADCGFTSTREIIKAVIRQMKLPANLAYPFVRLGALLFAGFDPDSNSAITAVAKCKVPIIFYHGESDDFVPCSMSKQNYEACTSKKTLVTMPGAAHGLSYPVDPKRYIATMKAFFYPEHTESSDNANAHSEA